MVPVGYAFGSIDEMGDGMFRKVRRELGVTAFGVNVLVLAPGIVGRPHDDDEQDELYFVHRGRARFEVGPAQVHERRRRGSRDAGRRRERGLRRPRRPPGRARHLLRAT
jgi:hypothetical protein